MSAAPIVWTETYSVGIRDLDEAHRRLIDLVNVLLTSDGGGYLGKSVQDLLMQTLAHFAFEEAYLNSRNSPITSRHQAEHIRLFAELQVICQRLLKEDGRRLDEAMAAFLRHWTVSHIMAHDKRDSLIMAKAS
ncbi:MAG: hemerythrin domain-containing protein [Rhodospirillales bacterium]